MRLQDFLQFEIKKMPKIEGLPWLILATFISPYIPNLMPLVFMVGWMLILGFVVGYWIHASPRARVDRTLPAYSRSVPCHGLPILSHKSLEARKETELNLQEFLNASPTTRLQKSIHHALSQLLARFCADPIFQAMKMPDKDARSARFVQDVLFPKTETISIGFLEWFTEQKKGHLEQKLWIQISNVILNHVKNYKRMRQVVLRDNLSSMEARRTFSKKPTPSGTNPVKTASLDALSMEKDGSGPLLDPLQHLDDFNDMTDEDNTGTWEFTDNASSPDGGVNALPRNNIDELNLQIGLRMLSLGVLHPAVGNPDQERAYIRLIVDQIWSSFGLPGSALTKDSSPNNFVRILCREVLSCQYLWPFMDKWTQPDFLNQFVLERV